VSAYYNEWDSFAAQWLRNLIAKGLIPAGEVDERSICDVHADDLRGFRQCHFFAGIGGWSRALSLANWPNEKKVWTGSCPCQSISVAGKQKGADDERHLWPAFYSLIAKCRPSIVFGEQVAGALGLAWLAGVRADLEGAGYACGAAVLCAAGVGSPHIRSRIFWCAADNAGCDRHDNEKSEICAGRFSSKLSGWDNDMENSTGQRSKGKHKSWVNKPWPSIVADRASFWDDAEWVTGADGKARRVKPGIPMLAHGLPNRVGRLRGYGNAIVPQVAAEMISAFMECAP